MKGKLRTSKSAQKELSQLSQTHAQQSQELKELKKLLKSNEESVADLKRELAEKKRNAGAMQERVCQNGKWVVHVKIITGKKI